MMAYYFSQGVAASKKSSSSPLLRDLISAGIKKPAYPSCYRSRSLAATSLPKLQIRRSFSSLVFVWTCGVPERWQLGSLADLRGDLWRRPTTSDGSWEVQWIEAWFAASGLRRARQMEIFLSARITMGKHGGSTGSSPYYISSLEDKNQNANELFGQGPEIHYSRRCRGSHTHRWPRTSSGRGARAFTTTPTATPLC